MLVCAYIADALALLGIIAKMHRGFRRNGVVVTNLKEIRSA